MTTVDQRPSLRHEVEDFLYLDAALLDEWRLEEWLQLWRPTGRYLIPSTDRPEGDPEHTLYLIQDDWFLLNERVEGLLKGTAWAEVPPSKTFRVVSNVRAVELDDGTVDAHANVLLYRARRNQVDAFPARLRLHLARGGPAGFQIERRTAVLALDELRPHGRLSVLV